MRESFKLSHDIEFKTRLKSEGTPAGDKLGRSPNPASFNAFLNKLLLAWVSSIQISASPVVLIKICSKSTDHDVTNMPVLKSPPQLQDLFVKNVHRV
jgi:hypothetical protein